MRACFATFGSHCSFKFAMLSVMIYAFFTIETGRPLGELLSEQGIYFQEMARVQQATAMHMQLAMGRFLEVLMGVNGTFSQIKPSPTSKHTAMIELEDYISMIKYVVLRDFEAAVILGDENRAKLLKHNESVDSAQFFLCDGIANLAMFKRSGQTRRRHVVVARRNLKHAKVVAKTAPLYALGKVALLKAELYSVSGRSQHKAIQSYMYAISLANSNNALLLEAMAHELYGRFLEDPETSLFHLEKAVMVYRAWNAYKKADMLEAEIRGGKSTS